MTSLPGAAAATRSTACMIEFSSHLPAASVRRLARTTRGKPEGRAGGANTYKSPHIRLRHYRADAFVTIALRLEPMEGDPSLADVETALKAPARPLFIGRKPCLPSRPVLSEPPLEADNLFAALRAAPLAQTGQPHDRRAIWQQEVRFAIPPTEWPQDVKHNTRMVADIRDWRAGVHAGESRLDRFSLPLAGFTPMSSEALP